MPIVLRATAPCSADWQSAVSPVVNRLPVIIPKKAGFMCNTRVILKGNFRNKAASSLAIGDLRLAISEITYENRYNQEKKTPSLTTRMPVNIKLALYRLNFTL